MTTRALLATVLFATPLLAQEAQAPASTGKPWLVSMATWGKFATLGATAGFLALAAGAHASAENDYDALLTRCQADPPRCVLGGSGTYLDPASEALYQGALDGDASARRWLLVSQVTLAASAVLWIVDLTKGGGDPENIPYLPLRLSVAPNEARLGVHFQF